jgi:dCTP deaminase
MLRGAGPYLIGIIALPGYMGIVDSVPKIFARDYHDALVQYPNEDHRCGFDPLSSRRSESVADNLSLMEAMMFLSNERILERCALGDESLIRPDTFKTANVRQASYDLRLGAASYVVGNDAPIQLNEEKHPYLTIAPGQFALLTTAEFLQMPTDLLGFITLRNTYKMQGLINVSGFHVDPTHHGILIFAVNNIGPSDIRLRFEEDTFTIFFACVEGAVGKARAPFGDDLPLQYVQLLGGSSVTLSKLQKELEDLRTKLLLYVPLGIALLIALILNLLKGR